MALRTAKTNSIADRIMPVGELPNGFSMLVYGRAGTGKTAFGATFPKPILVLDIREKGTETISQEEEIDAISIEEWQDLEDIYWYLEGGKHNYKTIVLDQVTQMQELGMRKIRSDKDMKASDTFSQRNWGQLGGLMQEQLDKFRELTGKGYNILFIAHERETRGEGEEGDERINPSVGARLTPSSASFINGAVSAIGNTFILERYEKGEDKKKVRIVEYCMRVGPHSVYTAKIRKPRDADVVPEYIVNPTYEKIMKIARGESLTKRKVKKL